MVARSILQLSLVERLIVAALVTLPAAAVFAVVNGYFRPA